MPADPRRVKDLFAAALDRPDPADRAALLDRECAGDPDLRRRLDVLLAAHDQPESALERPLAATGAFEPRAETAGAIIADKYKLLEPIGEGGMGEVWVADQLEPIRRRVALKLIKAGMDSKSVLARFEAERQALALMDHPNIARVLDAGATADGRPFFALELVKGTPITEFCDARKLSPRERLELFVPVCQAIQHAHQKGIIHRDIKPSNVLVALHDEHPVPKVIDFGVAKAIGQQLTEKTLYTGFGALVGTPAYMAPEQATFNQLDVDTRADVYALGVLLYELLAGSPPFEPARLKQAALDEVLRLVREEEPQRPSARLSTSQARATIAAVRQTDPDKLTRLIRGELDWIVMKALEKERTRRYETANGLAMDVQRHLAGEPVLAVPPSAGYRLRKFVRKYRAGLTTAAALALLLVAGVAVSTWQAVRATRLEAAARLAESEARQAQQAAAERAEGERLATLAAQHQKAQAEAARDNEARERGYAEAIAQFVKDDFLALTSVEGQERFGGKELSRAATLRELLDRAAEKLKDRKDLVPRTEAELSWIIGVSYRGMGDFARAIPFLERSVELHRLASGPEAEATLSAQHSLAVAYRGAGEYHRALPLQEDTLKLMKARFGPVNSNTLICLINLAAAYQAAGKLDLALPLFEEALKLRKAHLGADHPHTLASMGNLAGAYKDAGKLDLALPLHEETLRLRKVKLGLEHPLTLTSMNNLASTYQDAGKLDLALPLFEEALKLRKARLGPDHPDTLRSMNNLAMAYQAVGKLDPAVPLFEETLKLFTAKLGPDHPHTLTSMGNLGKAYCHASQGEKAAATLKEFVARRRKRAKPDDPQFAVLLAYVAHELSKCRQYAAVEEMLRECLAIREKTHPDFWTTFNTRSMLGGALLGQKKYADAEPLLLEGYRGMKEREDKIPPVGKVRLPEAADRLVELYTAVGKPDEAARWRAVRAALTPPPVEKAPAPREVK